MPVPKKRTSQSRRGHRRSHDSLKSPAYNECPQCHEIKQPHHVCPHCGYYKGKEVMEVEAV
ncbi:MAG: 50S ribosomal protein L32 [Nitrospinaceae bacterium]|nr:50S ribosomal protein L32 [Nitrospinaceae bacterium]NIR57602.1 50S ribosomal protein L32 [Nitrospinaceae bacterium]NIS88072.1 50S ribosomal protein L32 [Nitrospinaceae bacterium]NIT84936.1 50S ribosomal protein L32 [Nitrospinaceae bacterium]NIU47112.1 50S ribosomal protein L32 [Nitrospinaceae bacterium]